MLRNNAIRHAAPIADKRAKIFCDVTARSGKKTASIRCTSISKCQDNGIESARSAGPIGCP